MKSFFTVLLFKYWSRFPRKIVKLVSLDISKMWLDNRHALGTCLEQKSCTGWSPYIPNVRSMWLLDSELYSHGLLRRVNTFVIMCANTSMMCTQPFQRNHIKDYCQSLLAAFNLFLFGFPRQNSNITLFNSIYGLAGVITLCKWNPELKGCKEDFLKCSCIENWAQEMMNVMFLVYLLICMHLQSNIGGFFLS